MCRLPTPSKPALHTRYLTLVDDRAGRTFPQRACPLRRSSCDGCGYELIAAKPQSPFCRRLLQRHSQAVGRGRRWSAGAGADRDQVLAVAGNGADPGLGVVVRPGVGQRLAGDQRASGSRTRARRAERYFMPPELHPMAPARKGYLTSVVSKSVGMVISSTSKSSEFPAADRRSSRRPACARHSWNSSVWVWRGASACWPGFAPLCEIRH